ncbi:pyridoxamine 5'-phosphate oxidase [Devosia sp. H5989]|nr:pyridoxamine 5'-phosphate oxidase [Devosia sp. H5989]
MAKQYPDIDGVQSEFISRQKIFFTATATAGSRVNISPRPTDCLRVLSPNRVVYLDLTGSGNETAAHTRVDGRMTIMFCSFEGPPKILRLYGKGRIIAHGSAEYGELLAAHYNNEEPLGARQIASLDIDLVQTSCGFGVPLFDYAGERPTLARWAEAKEKDVGLDAYRREKNQFSIDGLPTGLFEEPAE